MELGQQPEGLRPASSADAVIITDYARVRALSALELVELSHIADRGVSGHSPLHDFGPNVNGIGMMLSCLRGLEIPEDVQSALAVIRAQESAWAKRSFDAKQVTATYDGLPESVGQINPTERLRVTLEASQKLVIASAAFLEFAEKIDPKSFNDPYADETIGDLVTAVRKINSIASSQAALITGQYPATVVSGDNIVPLIITQFGQWKTDFVSQNLSTSSNLGSDLGLSVQPDLLMRALVGCAANAAEIASDKGLVLDFKIEISRSAENRVNIRLTDNIPGGFPAAGLEIDPAQPDRQKACSVFFSSRSTEPGSGYPPGTKVLAGGVGLAEVYYIVKLMGGTVNIANNANGIGSTIELGFPATQIQ